MRDADPMTATVQAGGARTSAAVRHRLPWLARLSGGTLAHAVLVIVFVLATVSVLCVLATYFMGALAFSRWVGCAAALGIAVEREVIAWGVADWRDDAFAFAVALSICAMLYHRRKPSIGSAVALGASAALACLTRIFSVSFLAPGFFLLLVSPAGSWQRRLRGVMTAALTAMALVAPYLVNCWREFGDPLYTLNAPPTTPSSSDWIPSRRRQPTPKTFPRCGSFSTACSSARSPSHGTLRRSGRMSWC
jgi:4-amino-4-deoxy-L-arabinose transferase-like glycosyltransferase